MELLRTLLTYPLPEAAPALTDYWEQARPMRDAFARPVERAIAAALLADRLAYAFASGYQAALATLFPTLGRHELAALCATESQGAHPRSIHTRLVDGHLDGEKQWTTGASFASTLFVVASIGERDGRNQLRVAQVPANAPGVTLTPLQDLPFVPELPHASVRFENVQVPDGGVLEGDGYARYLKPFRTIEDVHVHAALLGYLISAARRCGWPALTSLTALAATTVELGARDPSAPETHVALAGLIELTRALLPSLPFSTLPEGERDRWERDRPLLDVAGKVRAKRLEKAREALR